ncbi:MAG: phosphoribosylformylglycinamidine cyclo-ligase [Acidobacteria bacterium]|nr:phosphoribosylformylglycinamidine cyclo-ligase [Acidobacteriota bacterium]
MTMDYRQSGVDIDAGNETVRRIKALARATFTLSPTVSEQVIAGVARACRENGCALIGGETAEMPGFYADGEYDIAGFIVGVVDRVKLIDGRAIVPGDVLIGLPSAGLHTNGYSLARHVFFELAGWKPETMVAELSTTVADALLATHRSYLAVVRPLLARGDVRGLAHVTGGGITENLPRILPERCAAEIDRRAWSVPPVFRLLQRLGGIATDEMFRVFNMGIGLIVACAVGDADRVLEQLATAGEPAVRIGRVVSGDRTVAYINAL